MDWSMMTLFMLATAVAVALFGATQCTSGCSHDQTVEKCLEVQMELARTSSAPVNLGCMK